ncbi:enoyl-CoA hydratase/isomerase [Bacillus paralicheniformis]|uniref:enoyl-CoA hydratase/isomerase n=1 Tax=Bacillus paralicheniformis TaxID=1648923 RepID=UPI000D031162|nr:enoyl-CoA hydratase/isomerase [Bacillus paralicheniformis]
MNYKSIRVRFDGSICYIQFNRPEANNTINASLIEECHQVLDVCEVSATIVVLEGLPKVFCLGADFQQIYKNMDGGHQAEQDPEPLYNLWMRLASGPYITISYVRGKANAGGIGFVAASDIVLADKTAQFSLSELLFGLYPACVLPFLIRRMGYQRAHYMSLMTKPVSVEQAHVWGLVDSYEQEENYLLHKHLLRLRRLPKNGIRQYKRFMISVNDTLTQAKQKAIQANQAMFTDPQILEGIFRFVERGQFPWEENK